MLQAGAALKFWLCGFLSCLRRFKIPKICRRAVVVAIYKPKKPVENPTSYCAISLLYVPNKILEKLIHTRVEPIINSQLPRGQAGFRHERSSVDQIILLTQNIENSFEAKKAAADFLT